MFSAINKVNLAMRWFGVACVILLTLVVTREVFMRYAFRSPSSWTIEVSTIIQLFYGFLCAGYVLHQKAHITWDSIFEHVKQKTRAILLMMGSIMGIFFCGLLTYYSWLMVIASFRWGELTITLGWPMFLIKLPVFIGFILLGLQFISDTHNYYQMLRGKSGAKIQGEEVVS